MIDKTMRFDLVVCGGGLAGFSAAIAAARQGLKTCLVHDRPVLGGNSSSEIRVTPHGAACFHTYARETGIISELLIEERARNHEPIMENGWTNSVWDMTLYDAAMREPNLTLLLSTSVIDVAMHDETNPPATMPRATVELGYHHRPACNRSRRLAAVIALVASAETRLRLEAAMFIDATGDAIVADLAGCEWRMGSEGREETGEIHAPAKPSTDTMGNSVHLRARDVGRPCSFVRPQWAMHYDDADFFYKQGRVPYDIRGGFWWIEIGVPWHTIHDAATIRHELTRHALGVWDWMKNRDPNFKGKIDHWALDWIGQVPGKRESRRVMGLYLLTEHDIQNKTVFPDEIAYGGWFVDLHTPGGLLAPTSEPASAEGYTLTSDYAAKSYCGPYGIPLRSLISKDVDNLMLAGRNLSATHAALGTVRVMATTALLGQAAGTAAAVAKARDASLADVAGRHIQQVQQQLLRDGCFLPNYAHHEASDLARCATVTASSEALVHGLGVTGLFIDGGINAWRLGRRLTAEDKGLREDVLQHRRGQWIACGGDRIDTLSVCLTNRSGQPQQVRAELMPVEHIWDYRSAGIAPLATTTLTVPAGDEVWVDWPVNVAATPGRYVRLDLLANPQVIWHTSEAFIPGHTSAFEMAPGKMRRWCNGVTLTFRVSPPQACFPPAHVLTGVTRPHRGTNVWRSDAGRPLPQWLELRWAGAQTFGHVELTFPGHVLCEYHAYPAFFRDPQTPRDYQIQAWRDGDWRTIAAAAGNYHRRRAHALDEPVTTDRLRVLVTATNGDPSAAIAEVRCYR